MTDKRVQEETSIECPFGVIMRFCKFQETRAKDLLSAMQGELAFFCKLDSLADCPKFKEVLDGY